MGSSQLGRIILSGASFSPDLQVVQADEREQMDEIDRIIEEVTEKGDDKG